MTRNPGERRRVERALELLLAEARSRLQRVPSGDSLQRSGESIELSLDLPLAPTSDLRAEARRLIQGLDEELASAVARSTVLRPGRAFCVRCRSAECAHSLAADSRQVLAGYTPSGVPRFVDFGQLLLELEDPRVELLFSSADHFVTLGLRGEQLTGGLLPVYRARMQELEIHGEVCAGWYRIPDTEGSWKRLAMTFQLVSTGRGRRRRFFFHLVGAGGDEASLEELYRRLDRIPWRGPLRWATRVLKSVEAGVRRQQHPEHTTGRIDGLLNHLAERLERPYRSRRRRTTHAERRHRSGRRPTPTAFSDLLDAPAEKILFDQRHETYVVLGPRGRTHFFTPEGKLVSSVRYPPGTAERRQKSGSWRPSIAADTAGLQQRVRDELSEQG